MKRFVLAVSFMLLSIPLLATKQQTQVQVSRPKTVTNDAAVPRTNAVGSKPKTIVPVVHPVTTVKVSRPATQPAMAPFGGKMNHSKQTSANATYTHAKTLAPTNNVPAAAKTGKGEKGLGTKDAQAVTKEKIAEQEKRVPQGADKASLEKLQNVNVDVKELDKIKKEAEHNAKKGK